MIEFKNLTFEYETEGVKKGVYDINMTINQGACIVLTGPSGSGKTTLTRLMNGLAPNFFKGEMKGQVLIKGQNISEQGIEETASLVGSVFQNPRTQFFNVDTTSELAFGCENLGMPVDEIKERLYQVSRMMNLDKLVDRSIFELSGGEKQRIACGSVLAVYPEILLLDEPSASLDFESIKHLKNVIVKLKAMGKTIVISEHRLHFLMDVADKFYLMENGYIIDCLTSDMINSYSNDMLADLGLRASDLDDLQNRPLNHVDYEPYLHIKHLDLRRKDFQLCVRNLTLNKHEVIGIIGHNGAGKSTFIKALSGLIKSDSFISINNKKLKENERIQSSMIVMQDVNSQLFTESVEDEIKLSLEKDDHQDLLINLNLDDIKDLHPQSLSGGQKQRVAIASALASKKDFLFFDEPTSGLDYSNMIRFSQLIRQMKYQVKNLMIITHDIELILKTCDRILVLDQGQVVDDYLLDESGLDKLVSFFDLNRPRQTSHSSEIAEVGA